jgi:D-serine deaminase-like pyridoxal phosphate-dependent protein
VKQYQIYKEAILDRSLPSAYVDLDLLDENIDSLIKRSNSVPIRVASKSVRSIGVLKRIVERTEAIGLMAFTLDEACYLIESGFDNILLGYPSLQAKRIEEVGAQLKKGKNIILMVDRLEHLMVIHRIAQILNCEFPVCIDVDVSTKFPGVYFGVHRSAVKTKAEFESLLKEIISLKGLNPVGLMGYEAQIAGVADQVPGKKAMNGIVSSLKKKSIPKIAQKRKELVESFKQLTGKEPEVVNAGGTGSIESSVQEDWVNEITIGSGFLQPALFDSYKIFKHQPAAFYALEVVRNPSEDIYTAHGGGYIASGSHGEDKVPQPFLPTGMKLEKNEGAGEVQTPFYYKGSLNLGDPVFFRHAKAGELCERFNQLHFIRNGEIIESVNTYRGDGKCFL